VDVTPGFQTQAAYGEVLDHITDLGHTSIKERSEELKAAKSFLGDNEYKARKDSIRQALKRLVSCNSSSVKAIKDPSSQAIRTS